MPTIDHYELPGCPVCNAPMRALATQDNADCDRVVKFRCGMKMVSHTYSDTMHQPSKKVTYWLVEEGCLQAVDMVLEWQKQSKPGNPVVEDFLKRHPEP